MKTITSPDRPRPSTRLLTLGASLAFLATIAAAPSVTLAALPVECVQVASLVSCTYTSGDNLFTVPTGVTSVHVAAIGGKGGTPVGMGHIGGRGAVVEADLTVTPGATLHAVVGGNGQAVTGGANGGGSTVAAGLDPCLSGAGGGGGASDVRTAATLASRILVAGGGGGAGCPEADMGPTGYHLGLGGDAGAAGSTDQPASAESGGGGQAGCVSAAAVDCSGGGAAGVWPADSYFDGVAGTAGTSGVGGAGQFAFGGAGGGGGGGYFGGGGGGSPACVQDGLGHCLNTLYDRVGGGGGGGSSLVPPGGSLAIDTTGVPSITISYTVPASVDPPQAGVSPLSLTFGSVMVGSSSASQLVTVTNTAAVGSGTLHLGVPVIQGSNVADFAISSNPCSNASLAPGASCTVEITFRPTVLGARTAILRVSDDAAGSPTDVALTGTGLSPIAQVGPASIDFGTVNVGTTSAHRAVTVRNTGNSDLLLASETITGSNALDFAFAGDTCIANFIAAGTSCTIDLTFTPGATGGRSATLTISDNGLGSPHTVSLTGTGGSPSADLAVSISASPNPVKTGQKVTYTITVYNAGPSSATSIHVNDSLSSQSTFVSATISQGSCVTPVKGASGVISCGFASLASGSSQPIQIVVTVIAKKTSITNTVTVSAATADPNLANNTASIATRIK